MNSIFRGRLATRGDRLLAWTDAMLIDHGVFRVIWNRFAAVVPGRLYRSGHPTPAQLRGWVRRHGIRTVITLRGPTGNGADALMREACAALGITLVDASFGSREAPYRERVLRLAEIYRTMAQPALVHCKSGADRAGIASALFVLTQGGTARQALRQLSLRFGHVRRSRTGVLDAFILLYMREAEGRKPFLDWVAQDYDQTRLRADYHAGGFANFVNDWVLVRE